MDYKVKVELIIPVDSDEKMPKDELEEYLSQILDAGCEAGSASNMSINRFSVLGVIEEE